MKLGVQGSQQLGVSATSIHAYTCGQKPNIIPKHSVPPALMLEEIKKKERKPSVVTVPEG